MLSFQHMINIKKPSVINETLLVLNLHSSGVFYHIGSMGYQVSDTAFPAADIPPTDALGRGGGERRVCGSTISLNEPHFAHSVATHV